MAQDILITPGSGEPQILFRGSGTTDTAVELNVLSSYQSGTGSGTALLFEGTEGQLFGITDNLSSGTIFSVADITGLPTIEVNSDGQVILCEYGSGTIIYNDLTGDNSLIHVSGVNLGASGVRFSDGTTQTTAVTDTNTQLSTEEVQDIAGPLVATGGTKTGITVTYQDSTNDVDFVVGGLTTTEIAASTLVTEAEGISSNDNDTTLPTSAAVKDYVDNNAGGGGGTVQGTDGTYDIQPTSEGATAGNTRGEGSVDLQTHRSAATQVASGGCSVIGGGGANTASGQYSTVVGGAINTAYGSVSTVSGGNNNTASSNGSTVGGGQTNTASGSISTVGGGRSNTASGYASTVGGGGGLFSSNTASGLVSTVSGGYDNVASNQYSTVGGGKSNTASGTNSSVAGGCCNITNARHSIVAGGHRNIIQSPTNECCSRGATIGGGVGHNSSGGTLDATTGDLTGTITCCDAGVYSTIAGGLRNCATGTCSSIGGGETNTASCFRSTVSGGGYNTASSSGSTVGGGTNNTASAVNSTVGGGRRNIASGNYSTVSGGGGNFVGNTASGCDSTVSGGFVNSATGDRSTVGGGGFNTASGACSTVSGGYSAKATKHGEVAHAAGRFSSRADAQHTVLVARDSTTDATANQVLFLDGSSERLTIPAETTWMFTIKLAAHNDTDNDGGWWFFRGGIRRDASNNTTLIGTVLEDNSKDSNISSATASVVADDTNEALEIRVTGVASKSIRWVAVVDISQVSWGTP